MPTIYDYLAKHGGFQAFLASAKISGFDEVLKAKGAYTVFAPTDAAFMKLPQRVIDAFLRSPEHLGSLLCFHTLSERLMSFEARILHSRRPLGGKYFNDARGVLRVNDARVIQPDIECVNGVIHVIDVVLIPGKVRVR